MGHTVSIVEAGADLASLVDRAVAGEEVVIAREGQPLVRLVPVEALQPRKLGQFEHLGIELPPDSSFFDPLPEDELASGE